MVKLLIMLTLVLLVGAVPEFKYVGQFNGKDYWASLPNYVEPSGKIYIQCQNAFGSTAYTSSMNTLEEWNYVKDQLSANFQCNGCTRNFWINGKYDRPHAAGQNIVITVTGSTVATKIENIENEHRYICEVPVTTTTTTTTTQAPDSTSQDVPANPTPVQECENDNDVIVVLDSSGSIGIDNYKLEKIFAYDLARIFGNRNASRFGFTIFSADTQTLVPLDSGMTNNEIYSRVLNATYLSSTTNTDLAITAATLEYRTSTRPVTKNLVVITDGLSNNPPLTKAAANTANSESIRTFSVGIGSGASYAELLDIAGGNSNNVFTAASFDGLTDIINPVGQAVCN